jgi:hypothetical protein
MLDTSTTKTESPAQDRIALDQLIGLISGDGWRERGFPNVNAFVASLRLDRDVEADERKQIALRIKELQPTVGNRAIASLLGSSEPTIRRDVSAHEAPTPKVIVRPASSTTLQPKIKLWQPSEFAETEEDAVRFAWSADVVLRWQKDRTGHEGQIELEMGVAAPTPTEARARSYALLQDFIAALSQLTEEDFAAARI